MAVKSALPRLPYSLTFYQKRFWDMEKAVPGTAAYVLSGMLSSPAFTDPGLLKQAILTMVRNNDATRLRMAESAAGVQQYASDGNGDEIDVHDFAQDPGALQQWIQHQAPTPIQLLDSPLFHVAIVKTGARQFGVFFKAHHLISDDWSSRLLATQVHGNYLRLANGEELADQTRYSYLEYVKAEAEYMQSARFVRDKAYWESRFGTLPDRLLADRASSVSCDGNKTGFQAHQLQLASPDTLSDHDRVFVLALSLAALSRYFQIVRKEPEVVFGLPIHNRVNHREKNTVGMFANSALLRVTLAEHAPRDAFALEVRKELKALLKHQRYPYPLLKQHIESTHGIQGHLYQTYVSYTQIDETRYGLQHFIKHTQYCPLILRIARQPDGRTFAFHFYYWESAYSAQDIAQLFDFVREQFADLEARTQEAL